MRAVLVALATVLGLAGMQSGMGRWLSGASLVPFAPALLLAAAFHLPHRLLFRLSVLGALAAELGSGLPPGSAAAGTALLPHGVLLALRRPRPDLPALLKGTISAVAFFALLLVFQVVEGGGVPVRLLPQFVARRLLLPSILAGFLTIGISRVLTLRAGQRFLAALRIPSP